MQTEDSAEIIEFSLPQSGLRRKRRNIASAQIIIFPGVRIERREYSLGDRLPTGGHKRRSFASRVVGDSD